MVCCAFQQLTPKFFCGLALSHRLTVEFYNISCILPIRNSVIILFNAVFSIRTQIADAQREILTAKQELEDVRNATESGC